MPQTAHLRLETMDAATSNKYILFNDAVQKLDDAFNRKLSLDLSSGNLTLTEFQLTNYVMFDCENHTVSRTLFVPTTVGSAGNPPIIATNRSFFVRNSGTGDITIAHSGGSGTSVEVEPGDAALLFSDGSDIILVARGLSGGTDTVIIVETGNRVATQADFSGKRVVDMDSSSANTYTINSGLAVTEPVSIVQKGTGQTSIVAGSGVTILSSGGLMSLQSQYSEVKITPRGSNTYVLSGDLA